MLGALFKPKWQHKDAKVRLQALSSLEANSAELLGLAQHDPDEAVRLAAIARLIDIPLLIKFGKQSGKVAEIARARVVALAHNTYGQDRLFAEVFDWLKDQADLMRALLENKKRDSYLRRLALAQIDDSQLLFRIASTEDSSARELQIEAATRLQDLDLLRQLEKHYGHNNKRLRQLVKDRTAQEQAREQARQALESLCADLEKLGSTGQWAQDRTRHKVLLESWRKQATDENPALSPDLSERFAKADKIFTERLKVYEAEQAVEAPRLAVFEQCLKDGLALQKQLEQGEQLLSSEQIDQQIAALQERWVKAETIKGELQARLNQRWLEQFMYLTEVRDALAKQMAGLDQLHQCLQRAEVMRQSEKPVQSAKVTELQSEWVKIKRPQGLQQAIQQLETRFQQAMSSLNARLQKQIAQRDQTIANLNAELAQMEADLEAEKYGEAIDLHRKLSQLLQDHTDLPARELSEMKGRLKAATPLILELKDWRRWGTDQAREHLIETAQWLENDESLDPQVRAREIKALREEWRKLAHMEPGQQRKQWKVFDSKVNAAYEVSKQHFAEQANEREAHLKAREAICAELETLYAQTDWQAAKWQDITQAINRLRKAWKECGTVGHKEWKPINDRFNAAMDALDGQLNQERERNFQLRQGLANTALALSEQADVQDAVEKAKQLRSRWQISVPSRPKDEQRIWKQFQSSLDKVFERLRESRQAQRSEQDDRIARKNAICAELEALQTLEGEAFSAAYAQVDEQRKAFQAIRDIPKAVHIKLEERFQRAELALRERANHVRWQRKLAELDQLAQDSEQRKQALHDDQVALQAQQTAGENLCLQLELLLNLPTPEAFRQARMAYQVEHLSEAMRSRAAAQDREQNALKLLKDWYRLNAMPSDALTSQQERIVAVRKALAGA